MQSVTEQNSLHEFLSTAELAGTEFTVGIILLILVYLRCSSKTVFFRQAEKLNVTFVNPRSGVGLLTAEETEEVKKSQKKFKNLLAIPRRY